MAKEEVKTSNQFAEMEEEVNVFWERAKTFEKSINNPPAGGAPKGDYVFYDGPPFATGTPHYGHLVGSIMKDVVPRYWTMNGYKVERKRGWDCHGLPIENIAEKELGFKQKKDIIEYGVDKFNELCRSKVLGYVDEWEKVIRRLGRWADMKNSYRTMDLDYMESIWWVFKQLWDKDLIYEGYRSIHVCPRCETTLSQQEVSEGYKDVKDLSAIAKFELLEDLVTSPESKPSPQPSPSGRGGEDAVGKTFVLAWTTTPWTLIGNVALAVGANIDYVRIRIMNHESGIKEEYILAKERLAEYEKLLGDYEMVGKIKGQDLVGKKYKPLFDYYSKNEKLENHDNGWKIYAGDFVTTEDGTGVVHIAPAFGEDDLNLGKQYNLPFVQHVGMDGVIKPEAGEFAGMHVKAIDDHTKTDIEIIKYLAHNGLLFHKEKYEHSYPHCWRCDTPLINYVTSSWFVNVVKVKDEALEQAKNINWSPEHIKEGRFGNWLAGARDWSISRQRFWASVMPIWTCDKCDNKVVFGSVAELKEASGQEVADLHKHIVDKVTFKCEKCGGLMTRVPDVIDTWFDSGSMPYAQMHYPFENKEKFEANFPAEFIAEGIDQTRAWFYYLHVLGTAIKGKNAFKNVIVNGIVLAEDGKKMAKRLNNYPDPIYIFDRYGADAIRYYLISSSVVAAENLNFSEKGVEEALRKNIMILWNVYKFYETYENDLSSRGSDSDHGDLGSTGSDIVQMGTNKPEIATPVARNDSVNVLDQWVLARLNQLIEEVTKNMNAYDLPRSVRPIGDFINDLSTWYIRRSRDRFKGEATSEPSPSASWRTSPSGRGGDALDDRQAALATTKYVLIELSKVMAPFMPFISEQIWQKVSGFNFEDENQSVHLEAWPALSSRGSVSDRGDLGLVSADIVQVSTDKPEIATPAARNDILVRMELVRKIVEAGLAKRDEVGIKIRQPLPYYSTDLASELSAELIQILKDELNVLEIRFGANELGTEMTEELKLAGNLRELVRFINALRKNAGLTIEDRIEISWQAESEIIGKVFAEMGEQLMKDTLAVAIKNEKGETDIEKQVKVNGDEVWLGVRKV
jgi:isoleucyl-tRNA synthetase